MANFQLHPKRVIINTPDQHPLEFYNIKANGAWEKVADPANNPTAAILRISGYGDLFASGVTKARGAKGVASQPEIATLTIAAGFITAIGEGKEFTLVLDFKSSNLESENANWDARFGRKRYITLLIEAGETPTTLADKIKQHIELDHNLLEVYLDSVASAGGVLTLTTKRGGLNVKAYVEETQTGLTFAVTQPGLIGRGNFEILKTVRIETPARVYPYSMDTDELPIKGALYSNYEVHQIVKRPDLSGSSVANDGPIQGEYGFELFINEGTCADLIGELTAWINANVPNRTMWPATTPAGILSETPVVATAVDGTAPFETPIV